MTGCWVITPVKDLDRAKTRLGGVLSGDERISLSLEMLGRVLRASSSVEGAETVVVSRDQRALGLAVSNGAHALVDCWDGLNLSLEGAARWCVGKGARSLLVVHSDLPLLSGQELTAMLRLGTEACSVVLAPCRREDGTNALFMRPPGLIPFAFGPGSFKSYLDLARRHGITAGEYRSPGIALDVDTVEDLEFFRSCVPAPPSGIR